MDPIPTRFNRRCSILAYRGFLVVICVVAVGAILELMR